jgi:hypothetical protein
VPPSPPGTRTNRIRVEGATFSRFDADGLVVEDVNFWDVGALLAQLGGEQPAGEPPYG